MATFHFLVVALLSISLFAGCGDSTKASIAARGKAGSQLVVPAETAASPADVCIGKSFIGASREVLQGTKDCTAGAPAVSECSAQVRTNCTATEAFPAADKSTELLATNIKSGVTIAGVAGAVVESSYSLCDQSGTQDCIATGSYFAAATCAANGSNCYIPSYALGVQDKKAIDFSTINSAKMLDTLTIAGVTGTVTLPATGDVRVGTTYGAAAALTGTLDPGAGVPASCSSNGQTNCVAVTNFPAVDRATTLTKLGLIHSSVTIADLTGTLNTCALDGSGCYLPAYSLGVENKKAIDFSTIDATKMRTDLTISGVAGTLDLTNLTAGNIKKTVVIGGVTGDYPSATNPLAGNTGTTDLPAFASTTGGTSYEWFKSDGTLVSGTIENNASVTPNTTTQTLNTGLYRQVEVAGDADLTSGNIKDTVQIFGVTGNAAVIGTAGAGSILTSPYLLSGYYGYNSSGTAVSGGMASRSGAWSLTDAWPGSGFYDTQPTFSLSKVCNDTNFFGAPGTALCNSAWNSLMGSGMLRDKGTSSVNQVTIADEIAAAGLPGGAGVYREIPVVSKDDWGTPTAASITRVVHNGPYWDAGNTIPRKVCGKGVSSVAGRAAALAARIADCDTRHAASRPSWDLVAGDSALTWNGAVHGNNSEGAWTLVTVYAAAANGATCGASDCYEVWRDDRTGLLWSDMLGDISTNQDVVNKGKFNWCKAVGNIENAGGIDCLATYNAHTTPISLCAESAGLLTPNGIHGATTHTGAWDNTGTMILEAKGGMMKTADADPAGDSPSVRWRVPTVQDWQLALANGVYHVLPNIHRTASPYYFWSASVFSLSRSFAWIFSGNNGYFNGDSRSVAYAVRCVGR